MSPRVVAARRSVGPEYAREGGGVRKRQERGGIFSVFTLKQTGAEALLSRCDAQVMMRDHDARPLLIGREQFA